LAVEWDDNAVATFKLNFPDVPVYHGDICLLTVEECMKLAGLSGSGELDLLDSSPPCQGFSSAGKRILDDPRNQLFREFVRLNRGLKPKVFVMENVSGMVKGKMKLVFAEIMRELKASGYRVSARLLNAMYFHVPQSRERMIFIGVREDLEIEPSHPKAESRPVTVREAMLFGEPCNLDELDLERWYNIPQGGNFKNLSSRLRISARYSNAFRKLHPEKPCYTMTTGRFFHPVEPRKISDIEVMLFSSFPVKFNFAKGGKQLGQCIGNSVPPLLAEAIARHIWHNILEIKKATANSGLSTYSPVIT
jgi:DNA (cytosine-5)-methyltransferase 1